MHDFILRYLTGQILMDKPDDGGSGGSGDDGGDSKKKKVKTPVLSEEVLDSLKNLVNRAGNESEALKIVYADNKALRDQLREAENMTLREGKVAVDKAKADLIAKLEEFEIKTPEALEKTMKEYSEAQSELAETKQRVKIQTAQEAYGANSKVLEKLLKAEGLEIETETGKDDEGNEKQIVNIVQDGKKTELSEYADSNWEDFKPSLFNQEKSDQNTGRKFVKQQSSSGGGSKSKVSEFVENRNKRVSTGNPLQTKTES